ncbi:MULTISPECIES: hypothetical protein [Micrococcaceae]|uniref:hypothetical protein n=1 Tax=unclassified Kocuria TaxID=2649579 RepID=UPI0010102461|nr:MULTISPECIES: hypothetical protein [unclassified Kocuria]
MAPHCSDNPVVGAWEVAAFRDGTSKNQHDGESVDIAGIIKAALVAGGDIVAVIEKIVSAIFGN